MKFGSAVLLTLLFPVVAFGQAYIYPNKGQSPQQQAQQQNYNSQQQAGYDRALGACLEGRGYTVR